ncbi:MAG: hydrolase 1, exosortase A system-associated [Halioglobus sp.]|nr:hydrolase 1, exosortase A system-associated [Halioglobus sp.]
MKPCYEERGIIFDCGDDRLVGVATLPHVEAEIGVIILVGGPQYRVGSHRQFTQLGRSLGEVGIPSFRFDFAGRGDSEGKARSFDQTHDDITAAVEAFCLAADSVSRIVLWGLCDAASSAMIHAYRHPQISGMVLLNPWVHAGEYAPDVKLSYFYRPFLADSSRWRNTLAARKKIIPKLRELVRDGVALVENRSAAYDQPFVQQMFDGLRLFRHEVLIVLSAEDLTATEFRSLVSNNPEWTKLIAGPSIKTLTVNGADHTFSKAIWKEQVAQLTIEWISQH